MPRLPETNEAARAGTQTASMNPNAQEGKFTMNMDQIDPEINLPVAADRQPVVFARDGEVFATGAKALKWKLRYIEAFEAMQAELRRIAQSGNVIDLNDPAQLRGLLLNYSEKAEQLERRVQELLPSEEVLQRIATADGSLCITDAAKALQMRPNDLFSWLRENGWIYRRAGAGHDLGYQAKTATGLLEHKVTTVLRADGSEKITEQVRVTPRGLEKLAKLIQPTARLIDGGDHAAA